MHARSKRATSLCACCALDSAARRRSTAALEVAMYVRDPATLRRPSILLCLMVHSFRLWFGLFWGLIALVLMVNLVPKEVREWLVPILRMAGGTLAALSFVALPSWFAMTFGLVKCPCCSSRFFNGTFRFPLRRDCDNCGFNPCTRSRAGDF